jgi:hypothetical protein
MSAICAQHRLDLDSGMTLNACGLAAKGNKVLEKCRNSLHLVPFAIAAICGKVGNFLLLKDKK